MAINPENLKSLKLPAEEKQRSNGAFWLILLVVLLICAVAAFYAWPRKGDDQRVVDSHLMPATNSGRTSVSTSSKGTNFAGASKTGSSKGEDDVILTVSGHIVNRERIALSPRYMGTVAWIGVKKGDVVTNGQVVVRLDDAEYKARLHEAAGRLAAAKANVERAQLDYNRMVQLNKTHTESQKMEDEARLQLDSARAALMEIEGAYEVARTYLDWTIIRSPIDGVVLEKLVQPNELVVPQSFGGGRGPSTALIAVADPKDLQVEVDLNESDLSKISMGQKCRVSPEAYPDKIYLGHVAEMAPEADRQKGTLQLKVQIHDPDKYLTPQLMAKVDFLK